MLITLFHIFTVHRVLKAPHRLLVISDLDVSEMISSII